MPTFFFTGPASVVFAAIIVVIWHFRRDHRNWAFRKSDYAWVFLQSGVFYVMVILLIAHFYHGVSYVELLSRDFASGPQITIAFIVTALEASKSIWDQWHGQGHEI